MLGKGWCCRHALTDKQCAKSHRKTVSVLSGWVSAHTSPLILSLCLDTRKATASAFHMSDLQQSQQS